MHPLPENWGTMPQAEKDAWWRANVYRGDMPQLTLRSAITGAVVGALLSLVNLYIGLKTGFAIGMGVTSVVIAYSVFGLLSKLGITRQITILENNAVQSAATAAGYMTGLITASLPGYMLVTGEVFPMWQAIVWAALLAILGVLYAFPWKRHFVNSGNYPFPEGQAAAVVMDGLHSDNIADRIKVKILGIGAALSAAWSVATASPIAFLPADLLNWLPKIAGYELQRWSINLSTDAALVGIGGIIKLRTGLSWFLGAVLNYLIIVPLLVHYDILPADVNQKGIVAWSMWPGVAMITAASLYPFLTNTQVIRSAFASVGRREGGGSDVLKDIELPMGVSYVGIPLVGALVVWLGHVFFGIHILLGLMCLPMIAVFTLIAANSTGLTSFTPTSALVKLTQAMTAVASPGNTAVNLATAGLTAEVTANSANLLMDIRAGWLLGAKPRAQAVAHIIGAIFGSIACTYAFYHLFDGDISKFGSEAMPLPGAKIWQGVALVLSKGLSAIPVTARWAVLAGVLLGITMEWWQARRMAIIKRPLPISAVGLSLGFVVPFSMSAAVVMGSILFAIGDKLGKSYGEGSILSRLFTSDDGGVTLASSLIAGAGLMGLVLMFWG